MYAYVKNEKMENMFPCLCACTTFTQSNVLHLEFVEFGKYVPLPVCMYQKCVFFATISTIECSEQKWKMCSFACVHVPLLPNWMFKNLNAWMFWGNMEDLFLCVCACTTFTNWHKCSEQMFWVNFFQLPTSNFIPYCVPVTLLPFFFTDKKKFVPFCVSKRL